MSIVINNETKLSDKKYHFKTLSPQRYYELNEFYVKEVQELFKSNLKIVLRNDGNKVIIHEDKFDFSSISIQPYSPILGVGIFSYIDEEFEVDYRDEQFKVLPNQKIFSRLFNRNSNDKVFIDVLSKEDNIISSAEIGVGEKNLKELLTNTGQLDQYQIMRAKFIKKYIDDNMIMISAAFEKALQSEIDKNVRKNNITFDNLSEQYISLLEHNDKLILQHGKAEDFIREWNYKESIDNSVNFAQELLTNKINIVKLKLIKEKQEAENMDFTSDKFAATVRKVRDLKSDLDTLKINKENIMANVEILLREEIIEVHNELSEDGEKIPEDKLKLIAKESIEDELKDKKYFNDLSTLTEQ